MLRATSGVEQTSIRPLNDRPGYAELKLLATGGADIWSTGTASKTHRVADLNKSIFQ